MQLPEGVREGPKVIWENQIGIVMANFAPNEAKMSADRWDICYITVADNNKTGSDARHLITD